MSATRRSARGGEHRVFSDAALERVEIDTDGEPQRLYCVARAGDPETVLSVVSDRPSRVLALYADDGGDLGLRVETADGGVMELCFRVPARPETVDGVTGRKARAIVET